MTNIYLLTLLTLSFSLSTQTSLLGINPIRDIENVTKLNLVINSDVRSDQNEVSQDEGAVDLAQRQLDAYNLRDIEAFLDPYAEDVEVYTYPDKLIYVGKEAMRARYSKMFDNTPNLHCELVCRIVQGDVVIDKERVKAGDKIREATAIYHIENSKIKKVFFIR